MRLVIFPIARRILGRKSHFLKYVLVKRYGDKFSKKLKQLSLNDSLEYAYTNFGEAEFFPTRELMWNYYSLQICYKKSSRGLFGIWRV